MERQKERKRRTEKRGSERSRAAGVGGRESFIPRFRMNPHKHLKQVVANCYNIGIKEREREKRVEGKRESCFSNALGQKISSLTGIQSSSFREQNYFSVLRRRIRFRGMKLNCCLPYDIFVPAI